MKLFLRKFLECIYILIFVFICIAPLGLYVYTFLGGSQPNANIEKRDVKSFPVIYADNAINTSFDDECEEWLNQNIPFRGHLISYINVFLSDFMKMPTANVVTGRDEWIFSEETIDDYLDTNAMSVEQVRSIGITLSLIQDRIEETGGEFLFVPVPNKNSIYSEYMPKRYVKAEENNLSRLNDVLCDMSVNHTDLQKEIINAKINNSDGRLYYKRDTHWTLLGAGIGYKAIMNKLGRSSGDYDFDTYTIDYSRVGDLDKLLYPTGNRGDEEYIINDSIDYEGFEFLNPSGVSDTKAQLDNFMSDKEDHDNNFTTRKRSPKDNASLYMIRDSFARALLPYMIDSFAEATFVRSVTPSIENAVGCDYVVYEICERNLKNLIVSAPFMYAPIRDDFDRILAIHDSDLNTCFCEDEGYALRIYGTVDERMAGEDGRIYVKLCNQNSADRIFEAFPIYEDTLLGEKSSSKDFDLNVYDKSKVRGYSLYIDKQNLDLESYDLRLISGNNESGVIVSVSVNSAETDSEDLQQGNYTNPYVDENASHKLIYRGVEIGIGDNINILKSQLGDQSAPSEIITSCLSGTDALMFYYPNITIEADMEGVIYNISLMDNSYSDGKEDAVTACGITLGSDKMDIWDKVGKPTKENDRNCTYETEHLKITYSYKSGKVTSVILEDKKYSSIDDAESESTSEIPGVEYTGGNTYLYDDGHTMQTGWQIIDGEYYFFDRITGERIVGQTVDGIDIGEDGEVSLSDYQKNKIETMMKAHKIVEQNTSPQDTMEEKRLKVFNWVLSFPYHRYRHIRDVYKEEGIEIVEANDIFEEGAGDCVSESAALAFLFHEIGYNNVYWVHDTGHSWVRSDDRLYDPLFAESKSRSFESNYDAPFTDYRDTMVHSMLIY